MPKPFDRGLVYIGDKTVVQERLYECLVRRSKGRITIHLTAREGVIGGTVKEGTTPLQEKGTLIVVGHVHECGGEAYLMFEQETGFINETQTHGEAVQQLMKDIEKEFKIKCTRHSDKVICQQQGP